MVILLFQSRGDLPLAERRTADTFLLALLLTIPLALTDFQALLPDAPVRGGAFAALILVLATSRLVRGDGSPVWLLADLAVCLGGAALAAAAVSLSALLTPDTRIVSIAAATGFLITALALLIERFSSLRLEEGSLIRALARSTADGGVEGLLRSHPLLASARIIDATTLADYPPAAVKALARSRVIGDDLNDAEARDAARDLLAASAATHLLRLSADPPRFLAISAGGLAGPALADELAVTAMLIERQP